MKHLYWPSVHYFTRGIVILYRPRHQIRSCTSGLMLPCPCVYPIVPQRHTSSQIHNTAVVMHLWWLHDYVPSLTLSHSSHTHTHTHTYRHASSLLHFLIWITFLADTKWIWMLVTFNKTKRSLNSHRVMCMFLHKNVACCVRTWGGYVDGKSHSDSDSDSDSMVKNGSLLVKLKKCAGLTD